MIGKLMVKVFGTSQERNIKKITPLVNKINSLEKKISSLSDKSLQAKTDEFRGRVKKGEIFDDILSEAFAVVRETAKRTIGLRHHDTQLIGGMVLHRGNIAEMANGEGKTLAATLAVYLNGLEGKGVHVVTVNDYLARRDRDWMGPIYEFLGLSAGVVQSGMSPSERRKVYQCDIVYGTNNEFGFDYLRDNMAHQLENQVQRGFHYTIVDEIDSILIDEARTPLIISGMAEESTELYYTVDKHVRRLRKSKDYEIDEKDHTVALTEEGVKKIENLMGVDNIYQDTKWHLVHHINQAIRAHELYDRDRDYLVKEGEVMIIDEFTGRLMSGRRWGDGLHQAVEAKERVSIKNENQTLATITLQNYFKMYDKLSGMTGTAATEAEEFMKIYGLEVVVIPTNEPCMREELEDKIYQSEKAKFRAVVEKIDELCKEERPVLVGTRSVEKSEKLSRMLKEKGIPHTVLNAKYHEKEAQIVSQAGQKRAVTIATNMAGRGTDIKLGEGVVELGGLYVIGTERHESRRIDNQLRGRTGRQGAPGATQFYVGLEDELMRIFGSGRIAAIMERLKIPQDQPIEHPWITKALERAQQKVERRNFDIRKQLLEYDDVMNQQRKIVYSERSKILGNQSLKEEIQEVITDAVKSIVLFYTDEKIRPEEWDLLNLTKKVKNTFSADIYVEDLKGLYNRDAVREKILNSVREAYRKKEEDIGEDLIRQLERMIFLHTLDSRWKDHLYAMDSVKEGIGLRGYGQRDPLVEYKREAYDMFEGLIKEIKEEIAELVFKVQISKKPYAEKISSQPVLAGAGKGNLPFLGRKKSREKLKSKVGRNDPCPCGSGKKYKRCCGQ